MIGHRARVFSLVFAVCVCLVRPQAQQPRTGFYAAPDGQPQGDGTLERPWDLQTALDQPPVVQAGATLWLRGGTYLGAFVSRLHGTDSAEITIRPYRAERAILDNPAYGAWPVKSPLTIEGAYATFRGLEVTSSNPARTSAEGVTGDFRPNGIDVWAPHTRLVNNIVHDTGNCIGHWSPATDSEIYGNLLYFCGWDRTGSRGAGHALYIQNSGGTKDIRDNVMFDQFGYGIHAYTETGALDDLHFRGNVVFESSVLSRVTPGWAADILVGGRKVAHRPVVDGNFTYRAHGSNNLGYRAGTESAVVTNNYFVEGPDGAALSVLEPQNLTLAGNTFVGTVAGVEGEWQVENRHETDPHGVWRFLLPNAYEAGRATLVIYNWDAADTVSVDVGSLLAPGDAYELRNVQDYFGDVIRQTFDGRPLAIPMRGRTTAVPTGWQAPPSTFPTFGVFVLVRIDPAARPK